MFEEITERETPQRPKLVTFEWISIKNKRPEDGQIVAVDDGYTCLIATYYDKFEGVFLTVKGDAGDYHVINNPNLKWFPLPERKRNER